jgi:hypothetical protein
MGKEHHWWQANELGKNMVRVNCVVEGQTEETFVKRVLAEYLAQRGVFIVGRPVITSKSKRIRGGMTSYARAKGDIVNWLKADTGAHVTCMFDVYALPSDFPGQKDCKANMPCYARAHLLQLELGRDVNSNRFIPYLQLHEFEGLLFSNVDVMSSQLSVFNRGGTSYLRELQSIRNAFRTPEEINHDDPPSKRLKNMCASYNKISSGLLIAQAIGIEAMRHECPNFNQWLTSLESLGAI